MRLLGPLFAFVLICLAFLASAEDQTGPPPPFIVLGRLSQAGTGLQSSVERNDITPSKLSSLMCQSERILESETTVCQIFPRSNVGASLRYVEHSEESQPLFSISANEGQVSSFLFDRETDSFTFSYTAPLGNHPDTINVTLMNGEHINGSPFAISFPDVDELLSFSFRVSTGFLCTILSFVAILALLDSTEANMTELAKSVGPDTPIGSSDDFFRGAVASVFFSIFSFVSLGRYPHSRFRLAIFVVTSLQCMLAGAALLVFFGQNKHPLSPVWGDSILWTCIGSALASMGIVLLYLASRQWRFIQVAKRPEKYGLNASWFAQEEDNNDPECANDLCHNNETKRRCDEFVEETSAPLLLNDSECLQAVSVATD